jgi:FtsH-binding integral membrane protein
MIEKSRRVFTAGLLGSKITVVILLLIFSITNTDASFVKTKPRVFLLESIVVGLSAAVPFAYIALNRGVEFGRAILLGVAAFLLFFLFHVGMEFSGENKAIVDDSKQGIIEKVFKIKGTKFIISAIVAYMILLALVVRDVSVGVNTMMKEALLLATCGALPTIMIAWDRNEKNGKKIAVDFFTFFGIFFSGHVALQLGGVYT